MTLKIHPISFLAVNLALVLILTACVGGTPTPTLAPCSTAFLITAINNANATPATEDVIDLPPGCVYELTAVDNNLDGANGLPSIDTSIVIKGNGSTILRSHAVGTPAFRIFHVSNVGMLTLNDLTISNGLAQVPATGNVFDNAGGGIYTDNRISLYGVVIDDNHATLGGGIYNSMANGMTISDSTFQNNGADVENAAGEWGGAIYNLSGATITNSTFMGNKATESGGAIANGFTGRLAISNSTFSANATILLGGSAIINSGEIIVMQYTTITDNSGGNPGAAFMSGTDTIEIRNSIIADNNGGNCSYPATSTILWENLDSDGTCSGFTITDTPVLDPLMNNGGPTLTHALRPNSPAVDAADGNCSTTDQRGEPRPEGPACDLGAFELAGGAPTPGPGVIPAMVEGYVFQDLDGNGLRDAVEIAASSWIIGANITLMVGPCPGTSVYVASQSVIPEGVYGFGGLMPGTYCILTDQQQMPLIPAQREVTLNSGDLLFDLDFHLPATGMPQNADDCDQFEEIDLSLVLLNYPADTMVLPVYVKMVGGVLGFGPDYPEHWVYRAQLGVESYICSLQGFEDRLYCLFNIPPELAGTAQDYYLYTDQCEDPVYIQPSVIIPEPQDAGSECKPDLNEKACKAAGGTFLKVSDTKTICNCP